MTAGAGLLDDARHFSIDPSTGVVRSNAITGFRDQAILQLHGAGERPSGDIPPRRRERLDDQRSAPVISSHATAAVTKALQRSAGVYGGTAADSRGGHHHLVAGARPHDDSCQFSIRPVERRGEDQAIPDFETQIRRTASQVQAKRCLPVHASTRLTLAIYPTDSAAGDRTGTVAAAINGASQSRVRFYTAIFVAFLAAADPAGDGNVFMYPASTDNASVQHQCVERRVTLTTRSGLEAKPSTPSR